MSEDIITSTDASEMASEPVLSTVTRTIDLERREDRFIIFVRDQPELSQALAKHTRLEEYPQTPVTRTAYFGDIARGLPPALSIKARTYERERLPGRWDLRPDSIFQLLELKRTVEVERERLRADGKPKPKAKVKFDSMVEILRLSGSILSRTTYKSKKRKPHIRLDELLSIITSPTLARGKIDQALYVHLLETVHPLNDYRWLPVIGTEYERTHFVTSDPANADIFRATLDKRVTHYAFYEHGDGFVGVPVGTEDFARFEVKADQKRLAQTELGEWLDEIIVNFRAFRIPSKKYRGMHLRSQYLVRSEGLWDEVPGERYYAEFPSRPVRYKDHEHYVNLARYIQSSKPFHLYHDEAQLLEQHEHYVSGSYKGLSVTILGSELEYRRAPIVIATKPVTILCADRVPVASVPLTSREDVDLNPGVANMTDRDTVYVRSRGFLVESRKTGRIYKVGLERRVTGSNSEPEYFVVVEYIGRARGRPRFDYRPIARDIALLWRFLKKDPLLKGG